MNRVAEKPASRAAETGLEKLIDEAVGQYYEANGIKAIPVQFGVHVPSAFGNVAVRIGEGTRPTVSIVRHLGFGEKPQRGRRWSHHHETETTLDGKGKASLPTIRALVHTSLAPLMPEIGRLLSLPAEKVKDAKSPLWAHEVHPVVAILHPDLTKLLKIDPVGVAQVVHGLPLKAKHRPNGWAETSGSRIRLRHVVIAPDVMIDQTRAGTYLRIENISSAKAQAAKGGPVAALLKDPRIPPSITVRTVVEGGWDTRFKIDDGDEPAAPLPGGVIDWRQPATMPGDWKVVRKAKNFGKPAAPKRTPIRHEETGLPWHG